MLRLLDRAPEEPHALELHGQLLMAKATDARDRGNHAAAATHFGEAYERYAALVQLQPSSAGLQQSAGEMAQVAGRLDDALRHYQQARDLSPEDPKPHFFTAQIHIQRGEHDQAIVALERVLALDPDEPLAHASLANVALQQERYDDALKHISEAREIRPDDFSFRVIEASIHRRMGQPRHALELLIVLSPRERSAWFVAEELAAGHVALGDHLQVAEVWGHVHRSNPRHPRAYLAAVRAGEAMLKAGNRQEARLWLDQAQMDAPEAPETQNLARVFRSLTDPGQ